MGNKISLSRPVKVFAIFIFTFLIAINIISASFLTPFEKSIVYAIKSFLPLSVSDKFCLLLVLNISFFLFVLVVFCNMNKKKKALIQKFEEEKKKLIELHKQEIEKKNKCIKKLSSIGKETEKLCAEKSEFFYNISHELKTPLTVILGAIQLIDQKNSQVVTEKRYSARQFFIIKQNCYRLLRLINNILDISRIESGYIKINTTSCNIVYLVEEITQSVVPYVEQKNLYLEFDTSAEEIIASVDIEKFDRVLLNLLSNAIKYTEPGGKISVNVYQEKDSFVIKVSDTGIGIPKKRINNIFKRYQQIKNSLTTGIEGSGIGLSIVKSFVELHGGTIEVNSILNKGSDFLIKIPIKKGSITPRKNCRRENNDRIIDSIKIEFSDIFPAY
ncbi:sensor histidine kinase [Acetivibrio saccincola]|uniref:sensor histidine kinase n=1 Tax=Acetivibrio saccincola TaxID=1677857 RepID=UPI002352CCD2|nr:HAMP domain-containing sensor histidine kinase [Acetivibrio saccincola]